MPHKDAIIKSYIQGMLDRLSEEEKFAELKKDYTEKHDLKKTLDEVEAKIPSLGKRMKENLEQFSKQYK